MPGQNIEVVSYENLNLKKGETYTVTSGASSEAPALQVDTNGDKVADKSIKPTDFQYYIDQSIGKPTVSPTTSAPTYTPTPTYEPSFTPTPTLEPREEWGLLDTGLLVVGIVIFVVLGVVLMKRVGKSRKPAAPVSPLPKPQPASKPSMTPPPPSSPPAGYGAPQQKVPAKDPKFCSNRTCWARSGATATRLPRILNSARTAEPRFLRTSGSVQIVASQ